MGKPVRSLKILARNEAVLRRLARRLAKDLKAVLDSTSRDPGELRAHLARIIRALEEAGEPVAIQKPSTPAKKGSDHA